MNWLKVLSLAYTVGKLAWSHRKEIHVVEQEVVKVVQLLKKDPDATSPTGTAGSPAN